MRTDLKSQRRLIVDIVRNSGWPGHLSSAMSILEVINVLYNDIMHIDSKDPESQSSDKLVLSKGHAALALYVVLAEKNYIDKEELYKFNNYKGILGSHPCRHKVPGVDVSTGSLGHGLPIGVGMAHSYSMDHKDNVVYVILGDGEMNEGSIWEGLLIAKALDGLNLCVIVDNNASIEHGSNYVLKLREKLEGFEFNVFECDGHDENSLRDVFRDTRNGLNAVIANTVKGKGFKTMESDPEKWHYSSVSDEQYKDLMEELS